MAISKSIIWFATLLLCALNTDVICLKPLNCPLVCKCFYKELDWTTDCSNLEFTTIPNNKLSTSTVELNMNKNRLKSMNVSSIKADLKTLRLADNLLTEVYTKMFVGLNLIELDLSSNFIRYVDPKTFVNMNRFFSLHLKNNPLKPVEDGPFIYSSTLYDLYLQNCNITHISPQFFSKMEALEKLDLSGNPLKSIESVIFDSLQNLNILTVDNCSLTYIYTDAFKGLKNLEILEMSGNNFKSNVDWPLVFSPLGKLMHVEMIKSGVWNLAEDTFSNNNLLRTLLLSGNDLSNLNLANTFGKQLFNLLYLDLSYCNLKGVISEDTFVNIKQLLVLKLSGNRIFNSHLAMAISPLTNLLSLSLNDCGLILLPNNTFNNMSNLKELNISRNPLNTILTEVFLLPLTSLEKLDLSYCGIKIIKNTMFSKMSKLNTLILSGNKIIDIEQGLFENLKSLNVLELNNCELGSLIDKIFYEEDTRPISLTELKLSGNPLRMPVARSILPSKLSNLISLDMSECNLTFISNNFFIPATKIKHLFLRNNKLRNYQHTLRFLEVLSDIEELDLSFNGINGIHPTQLMHNSKLTSLKLYGNPWLCTCNIVDMWDWAASIKMGWLEGATKLNSNETNRLICYYDKAFPLAEQLPPLPGQPYTDYMTWENFVHYSDCPWRTIEARSVSKRISRQVHEKKHKSSITENESTMYTMFQSFCFALLMFTIAFVLGIILILCCIICKIIVILLCSKKPNVPPTPTPEDNDEQVF